MKEFNVYKCNGPDFKIGTVKAKNAKDAIQLAKKKRMDPAPIVAEVLPPPPGNGGANQYWMDVSRKDYQQETRRPRAGAAVPTKRGFN